MTNLWFMWLRYSCVRKCLVFMRGNQAFPCCFGATPTSRFVSRNAIPTSVMILLFVSIISTSIDTSMVERSGLYGLAKLGLIHPASGRGLSNAIKCQCRPEPCGLSKYSLHFRRPRYLCVLFDIWRQSFLFDLIFKS